MTRQDFIFTLFDNGNGLTLDQIWKIDDGLIDTIPDGVIEDLQENNGMTYGYAAEIALDQAREVFINNLHDLPDMLELKNYLEEQEINVSDMQVYHVWIVTREV